MKLVFAKYLADLKTIGRVTRESLSQFPDVIVADRPVDEPCYVLSWGLPVHGAKNGVMETGFFWEAAHIDTLGLYQGCSLNTILGWREVESFSAPKSAKDIVLNESGSRTSKYRQVNRQVSWPGVVLAAQNPRDRSIYVTGSHLDYYEWIRDACDYYRDRLFIKLHPFSSSEGVMETITGYANQYGCKVDKTNHSVIKECEFVITWNSSFAVDCFVREIPVVQMAPGYFHSTPAVTYSSSKFPDKAGNTIQAGNKLSDFLIWRYCFNMQQPVEMWVEMVTQYAESKELFPLTDKFSYANNLGYCS